MEFLSLWPYKTGGVHFVRIGENLEDVEEAAQEFLNIHRYIENPQEA